MSNYNGEMTIKKLVYNGNLIAYRFFVKHIIQGCNDVTLDRLPLEVLEQLDKMELPIVEMFKKQGDDTMVYSQEELDGTLRANYKVDNVYILGAVIKKTLGFISTDHMVTVDGLMVIPSVFEIVDKTEDTVEVRASIIYYVMSSAEGFERLLRLGALEEDDRPVKYPSMLIGSLDIAILEKLFGTQSIAMPVTGVDFHYNGRLITCNVKDVLPDDLISKTVENETLNRELYKFLDNLYYTSLYHISMTEEFLDGYLRDNIIDHRFKKA